MSLPQTNHNKATFFLAPSVIESLLHRNSRMCAFHAFPRKGDGGLHALRRDVSELEKVHLDIIVC